MKTSRYMVILAGGSGTRLWPLSRKNHPKQFLKIASTDSLVRQTALRLRSLFSWEQILIVCGKDQAEKMKQDFPELKPEQFLLEPCGRNTAPAIAYASQILIQKNPEASMVVLPADHKIPDETKFCEVIAHGLNFVEHRGGFLTLGLEPTFPATGYGYLEQGEEISEAGASFYRVRKFHEKPEATTAESYLKQGGFWWNSGMFAWRAADYLKAYETFLPQDAALIKSSPIEEIYSKLTSISVDYAILEKSDEVVMIPARFCWDDVGSLQSLHKYYPHDSHQNAMAGDTALVDADKNLLLTDTGIIACLGVSNLIVIRQGDAVLVLPQERSEEVKSLLEEMKRKGQQTYL